jgi:hypothetical protein
MVYNGSEIMVINVKDKTLFLTKRKLPKGFRQLGRITFAANKTGLLLYQEDVGEFYGLFGSGLEKLNRSEVLALLGLAYIKYDPREIAAKGGRKNRGKRYSKERMQKLWDGQKAARIRKKMEA